jgi:hypothetical protein
LKFWHNFKEEDYGGVKRGYRNVSNLSRIRFIFWLSFEVRILISNLIQKKIFLFLFWFFCQKKIKQEANTRRRDCAKPFCQFDFSSTKSQVGRWPCAISPFRVSLLFDFLLAQSQKKVKKKKKYHFYKVFWKWRNNGKESTVNRALGGSTYPG